MTDTPPTQPAGWYHAQGDPPGTQRYWDGAQWQGGPQPVPGPGATTEGQGGKGELASPGARLAARLIDLVVWIVLSLLFAILIGGGTSRLGTGSSGREWFAGVLSTLAVAAYEVWFTANKGGTPGKLAVGLRVARADSRDTPIDYQSAVLRVVPLLIGVVPIIGSFISFLVAVASVVMVFTDKQRQAVWDKLAKTVVVRSR